MSVEVHVEKFSPYLRMSSSRAVSAFEYHAEALLAAKSRVDAALLGLWHHGMSGAELYSRWSHFAEDVKLVPDIGPDLGMPRFSAREYACQRVQKMTGYVPQPQTAA